MCCRIDGVPASLSKGSNYSGVQLFAEFTVLFLDFFWPFLFFQLDFDPTIYY